MRLRFRHWAALAVLTLVAVPALMPKPVLAGVDRILWSIDQRTERYVDVRTDECGGYRPFTVMPGHEPIPGFDFTTLLVRAALADEASRQMLRDGKPDAARCPATRRWLRNRGLPPVEELKRRAAILGPSLTVQYFDGASGFIHRVHGLMGDPGVPPDEFSIFTLDTGLDRAVRGALVAAMPDLGLPSNRAVVARHIQQFPAACRENGPFGEMLMEFRLGPAEAQHPEPSRYRVASVNISACLAKRIDECEWRDTGAQAFNGGTLAGLLDACRAATQAGVANGLELDGSVEHYLEARGVPVSALFP